MYQEDELDLPVLKIPSPFDLCSPITDWSEVYKVGLSNYNLSDYEVDNLRYSISGKSQRELFEKLDQTSIDNWEHLILDHYEDLGIEITPNEPLPAFVSSIIHKERRSFIRQNRGALSLSAGGAAALVAVSCFEGTKTEKVVVGTITGAVVGAFVFAFASLFE